MSTGEGDDAARAKVTATAEAAVDRLVRQHRRGFAWNVLLTLLAVALAWGFWQNHLTAGKADTAVKAVQAGAVTSCLAANQARLADKTVWDEFLTILVNNPDTPAKRAHLLAEVAALHLPAAEAKGLDDLITTLYTTDPGGLKVVATFEAYIAAHEGPVDCSKAFSAGT